MSSKKICCFGEVLWDFFPEGKKMGGAPFNVANSLKALGSDVAFISRVGKDSLGTEILDSVSHCNIPVDYIQIDPVHPTGKVQLILDSKGSAQYDIEIDAAWDFIQLDKENQALVKSSKAFVFGSLVARGSSYRALQTFLEISNFSVFDLNLRPPFYENSLLIELMQQSDMLKFNDEELYKVVDLLDSPFNPMDQHIHHIAKQTNTKIICVTKGMFGAVLYFEGDWYYNSGFKIEVVDTVGAGDSFLGTLIHGIVNENDLQNTLNRACAMGALVAGSSGANPNISENQLVRFMSS